MADGYASWEPPWCRPQGFLRGGATTDSDQARGRDQDPVLRHKQEAILQNSEIEGGDGSGGGAQSSFPHDPRHSGEVDAERVRLGCRSSGSPLAEHRQISATKRRLLHSTTSSGAT